MLKQFILVAGYDYARHGLGFSKRIDKRMKMLEAMNRGEELRFHTFDFQSGQADILKIAIDSSGKRTVKNVPKHRLKRIKNRHYHRRDGDGEWTFNKGLVGFLSILHVYAAVREIGVNDPNTLHELSIFSHSYIGGPILVNSDPTNTSGGHRDIDDFDARFLDFQSPRMSVVLQAEFTNAYHPDGYNWIWGCFAVILFRGIMRELISQPNFRWTGLSDTEIFRLTKLSTVQRRILEGRLGFPIAANGPVDLDFGNLKRFFCLLMTSSYIFAITKASNRKTFGGLPGMSAEPDKTGRLRLSHVKVNSFLLSYIKFYINYLGIELDSENRKFAAYTPSMTC